MTIPEHQQAEREATTDGLYRKKPVVIEAFCLDGGNMPDWFWDKVTTNDVILRSQGTGNPFDDPLTHAEIHTLEGIMRAERGDWIIRGVKGEIYPCKPDIFAATYERAGERADVVPLSEEALSIIAACRDAFPEPTPGSPADRLWAQAIGAPESVPDYLRAIAASQDSAIRLLGEDAGRGSDGCA
jgi:hypothetical protein